MNKIRLAKILGLMLFFLFLLWMLDLLPFNLPSFNPIKNATKPPYPRLEDQMASQFIWSPELKELQKRPYDEEVYNQTYQTLLFNSHIEDAYHLALIAVSKKPKDFRWHERLAQTATWVGDYNTGMKEWLYVAGHTNNLNTIKQAAETARILGYDIVAVAILKIYLLKKPDSPEELLALAKAQNNIDQPQQALVTLEHLNNKYPSLAGYELTAIIYQDTMQWKKAIHTWELLEKKFGPHIKSAMALAEIYYSGKHFTQALNALKKAIPVAEEKDEDFWHAIANLAWKTGDRNLAILSYSKMLITTSSLINLIGLEEQNHPELALRYGLQGWSKYHLMLFFTKSIYLAQQLKEWNTVNQLILSLNPKQRQEAQKNLVYWEVQANRYEALNDKEAQMAILLEGLKLHPEMYQLEVNLLFLLITKGELKWVKILMEAGYENNSWDTDAFWKVYADAFELLNQFYASIMLYHQHILNDLKNDQMLIDYGHLLEKMKLFQESYDFWTSLWQHSLARARKETVFNKETIQTLSQIAPYFTSGTTQIILLSELFANVIDQHDLVILLNWMVPRNYFELISYFKSYYFDNQLPSWAGTNLALAHNDWPTLQNYLKNADKSWSRADLINAAVRTENTPLAIDLAFSELTERPLAHEIYTEYTLYATNETNNLEITQEYEKFVNVAGPRTKVSGQFRLTPSLRLIPTLSVWTVKSTNQSIITHVPKHDSQALMKLKQKIHRGTVNYILGYRNDLAAFVPASVDMDYQLASRWIALLKLGFNQENYQNAYMREGGVQDQLNLGLKNNVTKYDTLQVEWLGLNYYSQDRHYLADGYIWEGLYEHKFWLSYPDFTLGLFGNLYHFNRNGSYGGDITTMFPSLPPDQQNNPAQVASTEAANYQQIIPNNYSEGGFTFSFGNTLLDYSHRWRPYMWAALYYNTITALSNNIKLGLSGTVFGADSLLLYAERGTAQATQNQTNYMLGMRYRVYY